MRMAIWVGVATLATVTGPALGQPAQPQPERITQFGQGRSDARGSLKARIAASTKLSEADVAKVLDAMGPAVKDLLGQGQIVDIPNLGTFRVVRVPEHRDMVNGRPTTIAGSNFVEFLANGKFADAANQPGVKPADTVPPFEYTVLPDQIKSLKAPYTREPNTRVR
jgi:nucleoid DNA-binding protein